jgi:hypothetical protein
VVIGFRWRWAFNWGDCAGHIHYWGRISLHGQHRLITYLFSRQTRIYGISFSTLLNKSPLSGCAYHWHLFSTPPTSNVQSSIIDGVTEVSRGLGRHVEATETPPGCNWDECIDNRTHKVEGGRPAQRPCQLSLLLHHSFRNMDERAVDTQGDYFHRSVSHLYFLCIFPRIRS